MAALSITDLAHLLSYIQCSFRCVVLISELVFLIGQVFLRVFFDVCAPGSKFRKHKVYKHYKTHEERENYAKKKNIVA
jgi:hypothetical protein